MADKSAAAVKKPRNLKVGDVVRYKTTLYRVMRVYASNVCLWNKFIDLDDIPKSDVTYVGKDTLSWMTHKPSADAYVKKHVNPPPQLHSGSDEDDDMQTGAILRREVRKLHSQPPGTVLPFEPKHGDDDAPTDDNLPTREPKW